MLEPRRPGRDPARRADPRRQRAALRPGVHPAEREQIFERFQCGRTAGGEGGFGLGLAIGRELARRMGGELDVDPDGSAGTRFGLTLRTARSPADGPRADRDRVSA